MASERPESKPSLYVPTSFVDRVHELANEIVRLRPDQLTEVVSTVLADWYRQIQRQSAPSESTRVIDFQNEVERDEWISKRVTDALYRLQRGDRQVYRTRELQLGSNLEALGVEPQDVDDLENILIFENFVKKISKSERRVLGSLLELASAEEVAEGKLTDQDLAARIKMSPQRFSEIQKDLIDRLLRELRG